MHDTYTVLLFTFNEESRVEFVLRNFKGWAPVVLLDAGSTDRTIEIATRYGCDIIQRPDFKIGYFNKDVAEWSLKQAKTDYVFIGYCSLFVPPKLLNVFKEVSRNRSYKAVQHDYIAVTYGKYVDRALFFRRSNACHFFSKDAVDLAKSRIHHEWPLIVDSSQILKVPAGDNYSLHVFRDYDARWTELKHSGYADIEAKERYARGERTSVLKMLWRAAREFIYGYLLCSGYAGGVPGFLYHMWRAQMVFNIHARIWEYQQELTREHARLLQARMRDKMLVDAETER